MLVVLLSTLVCFAPADDGTFPTFWTPHDYAHEKAKKSRVGILYWFPVNGTSDKHAIFSEETMNELSRRVVVVNVDEACRQKKELRKQYDVPEKYPAFVMTDYYGNAISPPLVLKRGLKQKVDPKKQFESPLKNVQNWVTAQQARLGKLLKKAEKDLGKKKYKKAIPALQEIAAFHGMKVAEQAREKLTDALEDGRTKIAKAERMDSSDAIKALKKVVKEFVGTEVAKEAEKKIAELEKSGQP